MLDLAFHFKHKGPFLLFRGGGGAVGHLFDAITGSGVLGTVQHE